MFARKISIVLFAIVSCCSLKAQLSAPSTMTSAFGNFSQFVSKSALKNVGNNRGSGIVSTFNDQENIQGKRFLFDTWVKGVVVTAQGSTISNDSFAYNLDKTNNNLLATQNKADILTIGPADLQSFELTDHGKTYGFEHVKMIDPAKMYLVLTKSTDKYSLYKLLGTTFIQSNYRNDGISQSGNPYDEYKEDNQYYIVMPGNTTYKTVSLKQKSILAALDADKEKVNAYLKQHRGEELNDNYLQELIVYLNK